MQAEKLISVQTQLRYMDQLINNIQIIHTPQVTSVGHHKQFLNNA